MSALHSLADLLLAFAEEPGYEAFGSNFVYLKKAPGPGSSLIAAGTTKGGSLRFKRGGAPGAEPSTGIKPLPKIGAKPPKPPVAAGTQPATVTARPAKPAAAPVAAPTPAPTAAAARPPRKAKAVIEATPAAVAESKAPAKPLDKQAQMAVDLVHAHLSGKSTVKTPEHAAMMAKSIMSMKRPQLHVLREKLQLEGVVARSNVDLAEKIQVAAKAKLEASGGAPAVATGAAPAAVATKPKPAVKDKQAIAVEHVIKEHQATGKAIPADVQAKIAKEHPGLAQKYNLKATASSAAQVAATSPPVPAATPVSKSSLEQAAHDQSQRAFRTTSGVNNSKVESSKAAAQAVQHSYAGNNDLAGQKHKQAATYHHGRAVDYESQGRHGRAAEHRKARDEHTLALKHHIAAHAAKTGEAPARPTPVAASPAPPPVAAAPPAPTPIAPPVTPPAEDKGRGSIGGGPAAVAANAAAKQAAGKPAAALPVTPAAPKSKVIGQHLEDAMKKAGSTITPEQRNAVHADLPTATNTQLKKAMGVIGATPSATGDEKKDRAANLATVQKHLGVEVPAAKVPASPTAPTSPATAETPTRADAAKSSTAAAHDKTKNLTKSPESDTWVRGQEAHAAQAAKGASEAAARGDHEEAHRLAGHAAEYHKTLAQQAEKDGQPERVAEHADAATTWDNVAGKNHVATTAPAAAPVTAPAPKQAAPAPAPPTVVRPTEKEAKAALSVAERKGDAPGAAEERTAAADVLKQARLDAPRPKQAKGQTAKPAERPAIIPNPVPEAPPAAFPKELVDARTALEDTRQRVQQGAPWNKQVTDNPEVDAWAHSPEQKAKVDKDREDIKAAERRVKELEFKHRKSKKAAEPTFSKGDQERVSGLLTAHPNATAEEISQHTGLPPHQIAAIRESLRPEEARQEAQARAKGLEERYAPSERKPAREPVVPEHPDAQLYQPHEHDDPALKAAKEAYMDASSDKERARARKSIDAVRKKLGYPPLPEQDVAQTPPQAVNAARQNLGLGHQASDQDIIEHVANLAGGKIKAKDMQQKLKDAGITDKQLRNQLVNRAIGQKLATFGEGYDFSDMLFGIADDPNFNLEI